MTRDDCQACYMGWCTRCDGVGWWAQFDLVGPAKVGPYQFVDCPDCEGDGACPEGCSPEMSEVAE